MNTPKQVEELYKELISSDQYKFPVTGKVQVTDAKGVYIIYNEKDSVLHVGRTYRGKKGINQRLCDHLTGTSSFRNKYLKPNKINLRENYKFRYIEIDDDARLRGLLENLAIGKLCPVHFGTGEK
ncbi:MAG: hypothetical protein JKX82_00165 [Oleispira sp.]|nr:hypothetical protein [Oleispira sp.]